MSIHDDGIATIEEIRDWWRARCGEREGFEHDEFAALGRLVDRRFQHDRLQLEAARAREGAVPPARECNGGATGSAWCGRSATSVTREDDGLEYFTCDEHRGKQATPIDVWFGRLER